MMHRGDGGDSGPAVTARGYVRTVLTPRNLYENEEALVAFNNAYLAYLEATLGNSPASGDEYFRLRSEVNRAIPRAQAALNAAGVTPRLYPPTLTGGVVLSGLANVAFAHEAPGYRMMEPSSAQAVLDMVRLAHSQLEEQERWLRRRRRNPLYWGDRLLRAVLGFPAYL
jgi:hypothetical protein